jgi:hypothetical protein
MRLGDTHGDDDKSHELKEKFSYDTYISLASFVTSEQACGMTRFESRVSPNYSGHRTTSSAHGDPEDTLRSHAQHEPKLERRATEQPYSHLVCGFIDSSMKK